MLILHFSTVSVLFYVCRGEQVCFDPGLIPFFLRFFFVVVVVVVFSDTASQYLLDVQKLCIGIVTVTRKVWRHFQ